MSEAELYNESFYKFITSNNNFKEFVNNNNHYKSLVLKNYNSIENYYNKNFSAILNKKKLAKGELPDVFRLKFKKSLDEPNFLHEYIIFSKKKQINFILESSFIYTKIKLIFLRSIYKFQKLYQKKITVLIA
ncbi:hypothetical protein OAW33_03995 [Candidatus Pelagibacter ubique]|nr:hypothetical protein [Candidatus Pelagibacter ubique]